MMRDPSNLSSDGKLSYEPARRPEALERNDRYVAAPAGGSPSRSSDPVSQFIHDNPTVALAGFAAMGAIVALALMPRREKTTTSQAMRRDLARQARELRRTVRNEIRDRGLDQRLSSFSNSMASFDWKPYVQPVVEQALTLADDARNRLNSALK